MLNNQKKKNYSSGFTLIELLVVVAIISLLSSVVLASLTSARAKARDARKISYLHSVQVALELYYSKYGTYLVAGTGYSSCGCGLAASEGGAYTTAVTRGLYNEGFLGSAMVNDSVSDPNFMIYLCEANNQAYAISAIKENPSAQDIAYIQTTCNGTGGNGTYTVYGRNYAVANKTY